MDINGLNKFFLKLLGLIVFFIVFVKEVIELGFLMFILLLLNWKMVVIVVVILCIFGGGGISYINEVGGLGYLIFWRLLIFERFLKIFGVEFEGRVYVIL